MEIDKSNMGIHPRTIVETQLVIFEVGTHRGPSPVATRIPTASVIRQATCIKMLYAEVANVAHGT